MNRPAETRVVCFGEVLWDLLPSKALPGGAPMNVAFHLRKLGTGAAVFSRIGTDDYGQGLTEMLTINGLPTDFIQADPVHPTGLVHARPNEQNEVVYDIVFPSAWDFIEWRGEFSPTLEEAPFFVYGSLASRNKASRETLYRMLDKARTKVLDINLRPPHFERANLEYLLQKADILKMNIAELELIAGWFKPVDSTEDRIRLVRDRFGIDTIIITMGGDGAILHVRGRNHYHPGFRVTVTDTIGSGDAFLAGFLHQAINGIPAEDALAFASGMGAFMATQSGACPRYEISQVNNLINSPSFSKLP